MADGVKVDRNRKAGIIYIFVDGIRFEAKGEFKINPGCNKRDNIIGADGHHGYKETPQGAYVEGAITDSYDLDTVGLRQITNSTVVIQLINGKSWLFEDAWYSSEGDMSTDEGEIGLRFDSKYPAKEFLAA
jgi:hypothetical protein